MYMTVCLLSITEYDLQYFLYHSPPHRHYHYHYYHHHHLDHCCQCDLYAGREEGEREREKERGREGERERGRKGESKCLGVCVRAIKEHVCE